MAFGQNNYSGRTFVADTRTFDEGLRRHMIGVYNYMMLGLVLTGVVAFYTAHNPALMQTLLMTPARFVVMLAPFAFILVLSYGLRNLSLTAAQLIFYGFSATMGLSMSTIFVAYTQQSVALVFFITAGMFGATSLYGYVTKANLSRLGAFLFMGLIGLVIASLGNLFLRSSGLQMILSYAAVVIFTGFTAYDTQRIKGSYSESYGIQSNGKLAVAGALSLYLDFINLFLALLRIVGNRR